MGVVSLDPENPFVRVFKEAVFWDATPLIAPEGDKVYFVGSYIRDGMICTIDVEGHIEEFARMDPEYIAGRAVYRFGTHLTLSSDGKYMLVDGMLGTHGFVAVVDMNTREFRIVNEYQTMHNHKIRIGGLIRLLEDDGKLVTECGLEIQMQLFLNLLFSEVGLNMMVH